MIQLVVKGALAAVLVT